MDFLNNPRMNVDEIQLIVEKLFNLIVEPVEEGDIISPMRVIHQFLFEYAIMLILPENDLNMSKQNVLSFYNASHLNLMDRIIASIAPNGEPTKKFSDHLNQIILERSKQTKLEDYGIFVEDFSVPK